MRIFVDHVNYLREVDSFVEKQKLPKLAKLLRAAYKLRVRVEESDTPYQPVIQVLRDFTNMTTDAYETMLRLRRVAVIHRNANPADARLLTLFANKLDDFSNYWVNLETAIYLVAKEALDIKQLAVNSWILQPTAVFPNSQLAPHYIAYRKVAVLYGEQKALRLWVAFPKDTKQRRRPNSTYYGIEQA